MNPVLQIRDLIKDYGAFRALKGLSLDVNPGEIVALLGPNGSGKTTTIRAAAGLLSASGGSIRVGGYDLVADYRAARRSFTYLPQQAHFPASLTVLEIARFHCRLRCLKPSAADEALDEVGLTPEVRERFAGQLSGGMRQRLSLAVASLGRAPLLLLDEPTANLDPDASLHFRRLAKQWRSEGRALLLSTHVLADVEELADRVIVLVEGQVAAVQTIGELRLRLNRYARLRVDVGEPAEAHRRAALEGGALDVEMNCSAIRISAPIEKRVAILERLSAVGTVNYFETEKPALEDLYLEYVHGDPAVAQGNPTATGDRDE
jgi:Cu-processing system ATP-binding protein